MDFVYIDSVAFKCKLDTSLPVIEWQKKYDELKNWYFNFFGNYLFICEIRSDSYGLYLYVCAEKEIAKLLEDYLDSKDYDYEKHDSVVLNIAIDSDEFHEFNDIDIVFR